MKALITVLLLSFTLVGFGQNRLSDRIYFGGGAGFSASSTQTNISLAPQVGYKITDNYSAGVGIIYQYVKIKQPINASLSNIGWSVFNRYNIAQQFFAYAEFERLTFEYFTSFAPERTDKSAYNSLLLGGGYSQQISGRAVFSTTVLYNVLYDSADPIQPYNSPWVIRAGVGVGIF